MIHRHLDYEPQTPVPQRGRAAVDDILDRGDLDDWGPLAEAISADSRGPLATAVLELCQAHPMYGTSVLWRHWIRQLRSRRRGTSATEEGGRPNTHQPSEPVSLVELRQRRRLRQADVAAYMGASQPDISKVEARRDVRLSTLRSYIAATGGRLQCRAIYPDEEIELSVASPPRAAGRHT